MSTLIAYHIPTDKDDIETPNAFRISKSIESISLVDIREQFPLPGRYHFRIKFNGGWLDLAEDQSAPLPGVVAGGKVVLKVLRLSWGEGHHGVASHSGHQQSINRPNSSPLVAAASHAVFKPETPTKIVDDFDAFFK